MTGARPCPVSAPVMQRVFAPMRKPPVVPRWWVWPLALGMLLTAGCTQALAQPGWYYLPDLTLRGVRRQHLRKQRATRVRFRQPALERLEGRLSLHPAHLPGHERVRRRGLREASR